MTNLLHQIFGTYTPITYIDAAGNEVIAAGTAGVDWEYLGGIFLFGICLFCVFKLIGTLLKR